MIRIAAIWNDCILGQPPINLKIVGYIVDTVYDYIMEVIQIKLDLQNSEKIYQVFAYELVKQEFLEYAQMTK